MHASLASAAVATNVVAEYATDDLLSRLLAQPAPVIVRSAAPVATPIVVKMSAPAPVRSANWREDDVTAAQVAFVKVLRAKCARAGLTELAAYKCEASKGAASAYIGKMKSALETPKAVPATQTAPAPDTGATICICGSPTCQEGPFVRR